MTPAFSLTQAVPANPLQHAARGEGTARRMS